MALDALPGEIPVPTRDELVTKYKRDYRIRVPDVDAADPNVDVKARISADGALPIFAANKTIGQNCVLEDAGGMDAVKQWGEREGVSGPNPASGATGSVFVKCSVGGIHLDAGVDELLHEATGTTFVVLRTDNFIDGDSCPIGGVDTGPSTNLTPGTVLVWKSPRPGSGRTVTVVEQADGSGLSGGRDEETAVEYRDRIRQEKKDKASSGNDADYRQESIKTRDLPIQQVFTYPAIAGTGTTAVTCTMKPSRPGGSRIPNTTQVAAIEANVVGKMPVDDGAFFCMLSEENADVVYRVTWSEDAAGWADVIKWPPYYAPSSGTPRAIVVNSAASPTSFVLKTADSVYTGVAQPIAGQTIAFYDTANGQFVRKRILSFTGTGPWTITVDTANVASDTTYTPAVGQRAMPWSESLPLTLEPLFKYFDGLGAGEQVSSFYDEGRRQKRQPQAPREWPHTLTRKGLETVIAIDAIEDGNVVEGDGVAPSVGTLAILSKILKLRYVSFFPE